MMNILGKGLALIPYYRFSIMLMALASWRYISMPSISAGSSPPGTGALGQGQERRQPAHSFRFG